MKQPLLVLTLSCISSFIMGWISHNVFSKSTFMPPKEIRTADTPVVTSTEFLIIDSPITEAIQTNNLISTNISKNDTINKLIKISETKKQPIKLKKLRYQFSDFPNQKPLTIRTIAPLEFRTCSSGKLYKSQTLAAVKKGMNLGGKLAFCSIPCGSYCYSSTITDLSTGKVYAGPDASTGYTFRSDSRLLIVNDPQNIDCEECAVEYYVWIGNGFKKLK